MFSPKKKVAVSFGGDDDVITHIIPGRKQQAAWLRASAKGSAQLEDISSEEDDGEEAEVFKPSSALVEEDDVLGSQVYGFKTVKKSGQMAMKACSSVQAVTPRSPGRAGLRNKTPQTPRSGGRGKTPQTPKSILKKRANLLQETGQTPVGRRSQKRLHKLNTQTPHRLRARNKADVSSESEDSASAGSDWEDDNSSTYSGPTCSENLPPQPATPSRGKQESGSEAITPSRGRGRQQHDKSDKQENKDVATPSRGKGRPRKDRAVVESETVESYFEAQSTAALTSDHTLSRLDTPRMDQEQLNEALQGIEVGFAKERQGLKNEYRANFNKWMTLLCNNYNILLHGLGSKRMLMEDFRCAMLEDFSHIVINGFFPSLTIKSILNVITEDLLEHPGHFRTPIDQVEFIANQFNSADYRDLYLMIHNIDGPMLRAEKVQNVLSLLAQVRGIHLIASIDHINAPLIWDQSKASRFRWLWHDVTTYESYSEETSYENSLLVQQSGGLALSSLTHVMRSLTPNAQAIFMLLARYQLENKDQNYQGLAFPDLYQKCRENFLVNSDLTLRSQLTEFRDHKLIRSKKGFDGVEYLVVPLDEPTLTEFLSQQEDEA